ncbi:MAG: lytic transglycosylase domain-containing protein [Firmicutes bacterium]|nr:lytic transglycosylase domain-containing protein [Bacillota bacterium]
MAKKILALSLVFIFISVGIFAVLLTVVFPLPSKYRDEINSAARRFDIEPDLIAAIIRAESGFRADAVSPRGAVGLMQLMPATARYIGEKVGFADAHESVHIPSFNITLGTAYLRYLFDKFGDLQTVLIAYNAGEGRVSNWLTMNDFSTTRDGRAVLRTSPYPETNAYVRRVMRGRSWYRWRI